ncbi:MAG: Secretory immunoglobulin A-binding protein EsiB [Stenotrophomonas maltophilia]|nr:MAG: Secretory immunoglobulin A-binding protein EsiB [Stenotrophomonas maltophilia]
MFRSGRALMLGSALLLSPLLVQAGGNSLLVPATGRCTLNTVPEQLQQALATCQQTANSGDAEAQFELGEFYYTGDHAPRDFPAALRWYEKASLQGHAQAQSRLGTMFFRGEGVKANNIQAYIVLKMAAVNGADDAMDSADLVAEQMNKDELDIATKVLGQIFRNYLIELQTAGNTPFSPLP